MRSQRRQLSVLQSAQYGSPVSPVWSAAHALTVNADDSRRSRRVVSFTPAAFTRVQTYPVATVSVLFVTTLVAKGRV